MMVFVEVQSTLTGKILLRLLEYYAETVHGYIPYTLLCQAQRFSMREKATEWLRENGFVPGVNRLVKCPGSVPKEYLLVDTTEIELDAAEVSRFRGGR